MKLKLLLLLMPFALVAQKKEIVYKKLANSTCECIKTKEVTDINLGICIFDAINKLTEKERKTVNVDIDDKMASIEKIAESVGLEMATICPDVFLKIAKESDTEETYVAQEDELDLFYTGTFESIAAVEFNTIYLLDDKNVKQEFIWLFSFDGDNLFIKNKIVKGDKLEIHYRQQEFFDPKQNKYRIYNEITSIKLL
ncbi:hypothetical protein HKT18_02630 [Flavobacterium sp. IMCC34852]|uniref:Uncharacterized protein n=1 Tax=Flavobacterium rivulicola TaxID=2732161 RepID=A0A7Y3VY14_9FLAO|nr:hypothetical protein [Flavobacterium sp. IMCC34852]NNT71102.1 hypothetical protein [Flavobacterium sp. IMCC34852]